MDYSSKITQLSNGLLSNFKSINQNKTEGMGLLLCYVPDHVDRPEGLAGFVVPKDRLTEFGKFVVSKKLHSPIDADRYIGVEVFSQDPLEVMRYGIGSGEYDAKIMRENGELKITHDQVLTNLKGVGELVTSFCHMGLVLDQADTYFSSLVSSTEIMSSYLENLTKEVDNMNKLIKSKKKSTSV